MRKNNNKQNAVGKIALSFRPYESDQKQILQVTKNEFKNNQSDALRELIREALERRRLVGSGRDATMSIVRNAQRAVISNEMTPLTRQLDAMMNEIKLLRETQSNLTVGITKSTAQITDEIHASRELTKQPESNDGNRDGNNELLRSLHGMLRQVTESLKPIAINNETALKK